MSAIAEAVAAFFERHEWPVDHLDTDTDSSLADDSGLGPERVSITSVHGEHGTWPLLVAIVGEERAYLVVQSIVPPEAPAGDEVAVLELLTRMNDGLVDGCFELNFDDGTIRLRSAIPLRSLGALDVETLTNLVGDLITGNVTTADRFIPALEAVIDHGLAPAIAVASVEAGIDPRPSADEADEA
jgi:hypothetical protein